MNQTFFPEVNSQTYFPEGHETYHDGLKRLAQDWFPESWHGENEIRLRNTKYDASVSGAVIEGARFLMAMTQTDDELCEFTDAEIANAMKSNRTDKHIAELEAPLRFQEFVKKLRSTLIASEISIAGLAHDGSDVSISSNYWKGELAEKILYQGHCTIDAAGFVRRTQHSSVPTRFLIFNSESINNYILHRSSRFELSKDENIKDAFQWLSLRMRRSPSYRPREMSREKARTLFNADKRVKIAERKWKQVWAQSIEATGAKAWSKAGPSKHR